jgi:hypothetical protein
LVRFIDRQALQHHGIKRAENRCIRADAESKCQYGDCREPWTLAQLPQPVSNIHQKVFYRWPAPDVSTILFGQRYIPKRAASSRSGFFPGHPTRNQLLHLLFEVRPNFF